MEMDIYDHDSYQQSMSNLYCLKVFHDLGINVSGYDSPITHVSYGDAYGSIFFKGINELFCEVKTYDYSEIQSEEFINSYWEFKNGEVPDSIIIIHDKVFQQAIKLNEAEFKKTMSKNTLHFYHHYNITDVKVLPDKTGIYLELEQVGYYHELLKLLVDTLTFAKTLVKEVSVNEVRNNNRFRESA